MGISININKIIRGEKDVDKMSTRCQQDVKEMKRCSHHVHRWLA